MGTFIDGQVLVNGQVPASGQVLAMGKFLLLAHGSWLRLAQGKGQPQEARGPPKVLANILNEFS